MSHPAAKQRTNGISARSPASSLRQLRLISFCSLSLLLAVAVTGCDDDVPPETTVDVDADVYDGDAPEDVTDLDADIPEDPDVDAEDAPDIETDVDADAPVDVDAEDAPDVDTDADADLDADGGQGSSGITITLVNPAQDNPTVLMEEDGDDLVFTVNPEFSGAPSYTWFLNGDELVDEDSGSLVVAKVDLPLGLNRISVVIITADGWAHSGELSIFVSNDD